MANHKQRVLGYSLCRRANGFASKRVWVPKKNGRRTGYDILCIHPRSLRPVVSM